MNEEEKIKDLKAVYSGAVQAGEIGIANMIKGGIDLIEKLQKENEEWQRAYQEEKDKQFDFINKISSNDLIPVQKVKDKIEELKNKPLKINQNDKYYYETDAYNKIVIQVLQELLEGKKQNV